MPSLDLDRLTAELSRIDLAIRAAVARLRAERPPADGFQGLYISEEAIDRLLARHGATRPAQEPVAVPSGSEGSGVDATLDEIGRLVDRIRAEAERRGEPLRLDRLAALFELSLFDRDALLICLAPEVDLGYERFFAYLHDDVTRKAPSLELLLNLGRASLEERLAARSRLRMPAPLVRHRLLEPVRDPARPDRPLLAREWRVDDRVASYLLGDDEIDERLRACARLEAPALGFDELIQPAELQERLRRLAETGARETLIYLHGPEGVGRRATAGAIAGARGKRLLVVDLAALSAARGSDFEPTLELALREAALQDAAFFGRGFDALLAPERAAHRHALLRILGEHPRLAFLSGEGEWTPPGTPLGESASFLTVRLPRPGHRERRRLWGDALAEGGAAAGAEAAELAGAFRFTPGRIRLAAAEARRRARWRGGETAGATQQDLFAACRSQAGPTLARLARKIVPRRGWDDLVLPEERLRQLAEIRDSVRHRARIWGDWGFARKLSTGRGLAVLFAGPPGTGKTLAAEVLAFDLGLDLYKIDLSSVVSKYIGETEKNLARVFDEAESTGAILFFDEADALFGKRTEVRDAHDRYANIETSYLLQKLEEYEGAVVLASNFRKNMDEAFVRRLWATVEFPLPGPADRLEIWRRIWPEQTPRSPALDLERLAERLELAGGNIRNIALAAAFLAAADGGVVRMGHLAHATRREFQKMGKLGAQCVEPLEPPELAVPKEVDATA